MRTIILATIVIFITNHDSFGQVEYGVIGGLGLTEMPVQLSGNINGNNIGSDIIGVQPKIAYFLGGYGIFKLNKTFSIRPEIYLANKGSIEESLRFVSNGLPRRIKDYNSLYYTGLSGLCQIDIFNKLNLSFGPTIEYLLNAKFRNEFTTQYSTQNYTDFNFALNGSIGYLIKSNIRCGLRYEHGLMNIYRLERSGFVEMNVTRRLRGLFLLVDYRI